MRKRVAKSEAILALLVSNLMKSSVVYAGIFRWHRFRFSPCLIRTRVEKSEAILDTFQELRLE